MLCSVCAAISGSARSSTSRTGWCRSTSRGWCWSEGGSATAHPSRKREPAKMRHPRRDCVHRLRGAGGGRLRAVAGSCAGRSAVIPSSPSATSRVEVATADGRRIGRRRLSFDVARRRDAVHRRRIRLGQVDDGARPSCGSCRSRWRGSPAARSASPAATSPALSEREMRAGARRRRRHDLPGADDLAQPGAVDRPAAHRGDPRRTAGSARGEARALALDGARRGPDRRAGAAARAISARALRRHAPARDDRDGARRPAQGADRRRADHRARRHRAGADPRADPQPAAASSARRSSSSPTTWAWSPRWPTGSS